MTGQLIGPGFFSQFQHFYKVRKSRSKDFELLKFQSIPSGELTDQFDNVDVPAGPLKDPGLIGKHLADIGRLVGLVGRRDLLAAEHDPGCRRSCVGHRLLDGHQAAAQLLGQVDGAVEAAAELADKAAAVPRPSGI